MAPKRSAPQPPPLAASSEEIASGSGSDESEEEEEEIAHSPPPAAPKAQLPQKAQESESDEEEEEEEEKEEEEEEEEEEKEEEEEEEEEEKEEEEEEENEKANHATPPAVPKNPPPPPPNREESESEEEEEEGKEEETDDEAPQPKPATTQEGEGKAAKPSSGDVKKPAAPFQRTWSTDDEIRILEALAAHRRKHGVLPPPDALVAALAGRLDNRGCSRKELLGKVSTLKRRYDATAKMGGLPSKDHDRRLFDLSKEVWGCVAPAANGVAPAAKKGGGPRREYSEMCEQYPYLAEEVKAAEAAHQGLFKRSFAMIDDDKARALDGKIKKLRMVQMKLHLRRYDLTKEVTKVLMDLVD